MSEPGTDPLHPANAISGAERPDRASVTARAAVQPATDDAEEARPDDAGISTVARRGTLNLVGASVSGLLSFVLVVIVTRTLHAVGAGLFFEATSIFMLAGTAASFGSDTALVRFISQDRAKGINEHIRRHIIVGVVPSAFSALIMGALLFWLAPEIASYFEITPGLNHNPELVLMIRVLAVFLPIYVTYQNGLAATVGFGSMVPTNVVDRFMTSALQPVTVFIAADLALGGGKIVAAWAAPILLGLIPIYLWLRRLGKKAGVRLDLGGSGHTVPGTPGKDFWFFALPRGVASIFQIGQDRIGILLVGALSTAAGAGVFAAAARWLIAGNVFFDALNLGIQPTMAEHLAQRDYARAGRLYRVTTGWVMLVSGPIYLTMAIFPGILLRPFGNGFHSGALALTILAIGAFAAAATGSVTVILLMGGKSSWNLFNTSVALGADVGIGILLIPHLGLIGAAISTDVALLIANVLPVIQVHRLYGMLPFGQGLWVAMTATLGCFALIGVPIRLVFGQSLPAALTYALLSCSAYALVLWLQRDALQLTRLSGMISGQLRWPGHLYHRQRPQDRGPSISSRTREWRRVWWTAALAVVVVLPVLGFASYKFASRVDTAVLPPVTPSAHASTTQTSPTAVPSASPVASPPASPVAGQVLTPASVTAFGPDGGDDPQQAALAVSGNPATPWHTDWYTTPYFGNLYSGTGLLLDMGRTTMVTSVRVFLGSIWGAELQVRAGGSAVLADLHTVATSRGPGGTVELSLTSPVHARYLLIWFTKLPPDNAGTYQASIYKITVKGE